MTIIVKNNTLKIWNREEGIYTELSEELFGILFHEIINNISPNIWSRNYERNVLEGLYRSVNRVSQEEVLENYGLSTLFCTIFIRPFLINDIQQVSYN